MTKLNLPNLISVKEVAMLLNADVCTIRQFVENGRIFGFCTENKTRRTFKIPRQKFYKDMGWNTDEQVINAYYNAKMINVLNDYLKEE